MVHVVATAAAVVASFFAACLAEPDRSMGQAAGREWRTRYRTTEALHAAALDGIVRRWNSDLARTAALVDRPGHTVVHYDALVRDPEATLRELGAAIGLGGTTRSSTRRRRPTGSSGAGAIARTWRAPSRASPPASGPAGRFDDVVPAAARAGIERSLLAGGDPRPPSAPPANRASAPAQGRAGRGARARW